MGVCKGNIPDPNSNKKPLETKSNLPYVADDAVHRVKCRMECVGQAKLAVLFLSNTQGPLKCGLLV